MLRPLPCSRGRSARARTVSRRGSRTPLSICSSSRSRLRRPISLKFWRTVVSGGVKYSASGMSSKPTTLMSPGIRRPASCSARSSPSAIWSLATNTAVTSGLAARSRPSSCPARALQSPCSTGGAGAPAASSVVRQPRMRSCASSQSTGPEMCQTVRCPSSSRCEVAICAPSNWSTATSGTESSGPASAATTGTSSGRCSSADVADSCGAITRMPSTPWSRRRSTALTTDELASERRLTMLTK